MSGAQETYPYMLKYHKNPETLSRLSPEQHRVTQRDGTERPL